MEHNHDFPRPAQIKADYISRPKKEKIIQFRVSELVYQYIEALAEKGNTTISGAMDNVMRDYFEYVEIYSQALYTFEDSSETGRRGLIAYEKNLSPVLRLFSNVLPKKYPEEMEKYADTLKSTGDEILIRYTPSAPKERK